MSAFHSLNRLLKRATQELRFHKINSFFFFRDILKWYCYFVVCFSETGCHYVIEVDFKPRLVCNSWWFSCLSLPSTGTGIHHHTQLSDTSYDRSEEYNKIKHMSLAVSDTSLHTVYTLESQVFTCEKISVKKVDNVFIVTKIILTLVFPWRGLPHHPVSPSCFQNCWWKTSAFIREVWYIRVYQ